MTDGPPTARARAREAMISDIKSIARTHVAEHGADGLSLRAVARELGVVSSAVYRYFASRDDLLTALIIDAFDAVGQVAEEAAATSGSAMQRWTRLATALRRWAIEHPHDYALIYGTPVAGYQAPQDTVSPATRVTVAALRVIAEGVEAGEIDGSPRGRVPRAVHADLDTLRNATGIDLSDEVLSRTVVAWTALLGHLSYELFGHLHRGITDFDAFFEHQLGRITQELFGP